MKAETKALLKELYRLSVTNKWLLTKAIVGAMIIKLSLRLMSYKAVTQFLSGKIPSDVPLDKADAGAANFRKLIALTHQLRPFTGINCLDISVAYWYLMQKRGIKAEMQIGVQKDKGVFKSHAWLEYQGKPLTVDDLIHERYQAFGKTLL